MKYASVCDGIGAAHVAWSGLGWDCKWTSEIEPFPAAVVERHFNLPNVGDMTAITEEMLDGYGTIDLLVGGTPCQSFSVAGLRGGLADPRGNLALRFVQLVGVLRPSWVVWENVPGVLSSNGGRDFGTFLGALAELGYGFAYRILDAQWFGVAQRRRRVFVVAHARDWRRAAAVLFERESLCGNPPTRGKAWEGAARSTAASLTGSGRGVERCGESRGQDDVVLAAPQVANPLTARMGKGINTTCDEGQTAIVASYGFKQGANHSGACGGLTEDCEPPLTCGQDHNLIAFHPTQDPISSLDGSTHAMGCGSHGGCSTQAVAFSHSADANSYGTACVVEGTPPLRGGGAGNSMPDVASAKDVRRLTPRECERLQGFPDDYTLVTYRNKPAADGPRYRALGNSMAVPVMRWIGERICAVDAARIKAAGETA